MVAVRDPNGFRPLCIGKLSKRGPGGTDGYCIASETCALDLCKAEYVRDVEPGEMIVIDENTVKTGTFSSLRLPQKFGTSQCIFEYVYFARPDSRIFGEFVTKVRRELGRQLAREHPIPEVAPSPPPSLRASRACACCVACCLGALCASITFQVAAAVYAHDPERRAGPLRGAGASRRPAAGGDPDPRVGGARDAGLLRGVRAHGAAVHRGPGLLPEPLRGALLHLALAGAPRPQGPLQVQPHVSSPPPRPPAPPPPAPACAVCGCASLREARRGEAR